MFAIMTNEEDRLHGIVIPHTIYQHFGNTVVDIEEMLSNGEEECHETGIVQIQQVVTTFQ